MATHVPVASSEVAPVAVPLRAVQPKCGVCSHPRSFHGGAEESRCRALGCHCEGWR